MVKKQFVLSNKKQVNFFSNEFIDIYLLLSMQIGFTNVRTIPDGSPVTLDYRTDRVRVFVDKNGIVTETPVIA